MNRTHHQGHRPLPTTVLLLALLAIPTACADRQTASTPADRPTVAVSGNAAETPDVLAVIGDDPITLDDVRTRVGEQLDALEVNYQQQRHTLLSDAVQAVLRQRLLAAEADKRGVSVADLLAAEIGVEEVTEDDIQAIYRANRSRLRGQTLDDVRGQIRDYLESSRRVEAEKTLQDRLAEEYSVRYNLPPFRLVIDNEGAPALGPEDAAVTLVEFSDFECPFCSRFFPTLKRIEEDYAGRVKIVYRQFPLTRIHPNAFKAAEASLCADEQGEFWAYHDLLFQEQESLLVRDLKEKAGRLGLDQAAFDQCLDTGRYVETIQNDLAAGRSAGVTGTPALFVNGIPVPGGAVAFSVVAAALDEELERVGS